jgi:hypothetical protein
MKKNILLILILIYSLPGYTQKNKDVPNYFPTGATNNWYSMQLYKLGEPVLFSNVSKKEIYRFTWLRTFHHPIAIRVEKNGTVYTLYWKMCDGAGGYDSGKLIVSMSRPLSKKEWNIFTRSLITINFWNIKKDKMNYQAMMVRNGYWKAKRASVTKLLTHGPQIKKVITTNAVTI